MRGFSVGESAIFCRPGSRFNGCEVIISAPLQQRFVRDARTGVGSHELVYGISGPFGAPPLGGGWTSSPQYLRRKPDQSAPDGCATWGACVWHPVEHGEQQSEKGREFARE